MGHNTLPYCDAVQYGLAISKFNPCLYSEPQADDMLASLQLIV